MSVLPKEVWTVEEYQAVEHRSEIKHEYLHGQIIAIAGASQAHVDITGNLFASLYGQLVGKSCRPSVLDMRVKTPSRMYAYPDVSVVCGERRFEEDAIATLLNPTLIIEVLSPTTQDYDRGEKFRQYRTFHSLQEYLCVAQDAARIEHYARQSDGSWRLTEINSREATLQLPSIGCTLAMTEVYRGVELP